MTAAGRIDRQSRNSLSPTRRAEFCICRAPGWRRCSGRATSSSPTRRRRCRRVSRAFIARAGKRSRSGSPGGSIFAIPRALSRSPSAPATIACERRTARRRQDFSAGDRLAFGPLVSISRGRARPSAAHSHMLRRRASERAAGPHPLRAADPVRPSARAAVAGRRADKDRRRSDRLRAAVRELCARLADAGALARARRRRRLAVARRRPLLDRRRGAR